MKSKQELRNSILLIAMALTLLTTSMPVYAQTSGSSTNSATQLSGTRKQLATIVFAGLSGAILGLSTLSFYGRPQDHLSNIAVGFAFGVITGAVYTTYKAATRPYEAYDISAITFETEETKRWLTSQQYASQPVFRYNWTF